MAGATPQVRATGAPAFEVERFEWTAPDRLEVSGRWFGVRGRRFMRPTLDVHGAGDQRRLLAVLDHKPWAAEDGQRWLAAFPWEGGRVDLSGAELAVAPGIAVPLDRPAHAPQFGRRHEAPAPAPAPTPTPTKEAAETLEAAMETVDAALRDRRGLERERDAAARARDAALADRETIIRERFTAVTERDEARRELAAVKAEQESVRRDLDAALAQSEQAAVLRAEAESVRAEVESLRASLDAALRDRDALREELEQAREQALSDTAGATRAFDVVQHVEDSDVREELEQAQADLATARMARRAAGERPAPVETGPNEIELLLARVLAGGALLIGIVLLALFLGAAL